MDAVTANKIWNDYSTNRTAMLRLWDYYRGDHDIMDREEEYPDGAEKTNRVTDWAGYIVDLYVGALTMVPFQVSADQEDSSDAVERYSEIGKRSGFDALDMELLRRTLVFGWCIELHEYREGEGEIVRLQDPTEWVILRDVYDNIAVAIRVVTLPINTIVDGEPLKTERYQMTVYDEREIIRYEKGGNTNQWNEVERRTHYYGKPPVVVWQVNEERNSILTDALLGQADEYNEIDSSAGDSLRSTVSALLALIGYDASWVKDNADTIKEMRILPLAPDGDAKFIVRPDTSNEADHRLQRIREHICMAGRVPDITTITGATGSTSGIALRLRFMPMEHRSMSMANFIRDSITQRIDLINAMAEKTNKPVLEDYTVTVQFILPTNRIEEWQNVGALKGIVSHRKMLEVMSDVQDPEGELEAVTNEILMSEDDREEGIERVAGLLQPAAEDAMQAVSRAVMDAIEQRGLLE